MSLSVPELARVLLALSALYLAAHAGGWLFAKVRQPRVLGEISGGLLLGPTGFGALAPSAYTWLFRGGAATPAILGLIYHLGLLLLMFGSGATVKPPFRAADSKTVGTIAATGLAIPFLVSLTGLELHLLDFEAFWGPAATATSFTLIFAIAMTVTSMPVISRIMHDLGILDTRFAGIVLGVALIEDVLLYVALAIAVGLRAGSVTHAYSLPDLLGLQPGSLTEAWYHLAITLGAVWLFAGPCRRLYARLATWPGNAIHRDSPVAYPLVFCVAGLIGCVGLGIEPFFGALMCGYVVGAFKPAAPAIQQIQRFSFASFVPLYFGLVGLRLDLLHEFRVTAFVELLVFGCAVKSFSIYAGARIAGQTRTSSLNLAVAMNARGGPGIMLASIASAAGIINDAFHAILVVLAIVTSLIAGGWLERVPREQLLTQDEFERRDLGRAAAPEAHS